MNADDASEGTQLSQAVDVCAVKPIKPSSSGVEVKRARVRSALVSDRVKLARPPDVSSYPSIVEEICQRVARYHGRSAILDKKDYDLFVTMHEQFWQDWEMLDKVSKDNTPVRFQHSSLTAMGALFLHRSTPSR